jgi:hypothetical protein
MNNDILSPNLLKIFTSFVKELSTSFPEHDSVIYENYHSVIDSTNFSLQTSELMKEFMDRIHKLSDKIKSKDENIFINDELILTGISFKSIWSSKINEKTKESIWKYMQTFSLLDVSYRANDELKDVLESLSTGEVELNTKDKSLVKDLKNIKELSEKIKTENKDSSDNKVDKEQVKEESVNPLEELIRGSEIGRIAEEVSNSINVDELLGDLNDDSDMGEVFSKLVTGGGMGKIFDGINKVVTDKVDKQELSKDALQKEAMDMCENMGQNLFSQVGNMMGSSGDSNPLAMFQQMSQQMHPQRREQMKTEMESQSNPTRDRLRKKLSDKNGN